MKRRKINPTVYNQSNSKVKVKGYAANHIDLLMNVINEVTNTSFIRQAVSLLSINRACSQEVSVRRHKLPLHQ